ncbi:hypothetical protein [Asanoa siamensis]|uniref:CBS domain-containing protein n=1 Tax=Asanoa siamensis TaxID=926357 RepID=A0ABQ4CXR7_9ACTN|nr:hypothetical protein [Asanoa siamensis]GIF76069.1 hypothetical protein Asi02nite_55870 [Asanoa siamensis]
MTDKIRIRPGLLVVDRTGTRIGRVREMHSPDPLAVSDDGRRIGDIGDIEAMLPGWTRHALPGVPGTAAARLVREGYLRIARGGPPPTRLCYAALTDVADVHEETVELSVVLDDLPTATTRRG